MLKYKNIIRMLKKEEKFNYRYQIVKIALKEGIKPASREFKANIKTVRKWLLRYKAKGLKGLSNESTRPKFSPNKCSDGYEKKIIKLRQQTKNRFGAKRLKERFGLKYSKNCIQRIINQNGLKRKAKTKTQKRNELWSVKRLTRLFEKIQVDVKVLTDISLYWGQYLKAKLELPKYEFTARDVKTGATFVCYANKNDSIAAATFITYIFKHLQQHGFEPKEILIQTDNGAEFNACGKNHNQKTPFENAVENIFESNLGHIPPASPTFNSDVETFHRLVEYEFYDIEFIENKSDLLRKLYTFLIDFNYLRKNSYKDNKTPLELAKDDYPDLKLSVFNLPPIYLQEHTNLYFDLVKDKQLVCLNSKKNLVNPLVLAKIQKAYDAHADPFISSQLFKSFGVHHVPSLDMKYLKQ